MGSEPQRTIPLVPLTPDDVRQTTFKQSQLAWRGYSEDEVDAFKNMIAEYMASFEKERTALRSEIERLRNFYRHHGTDVDALGSGRRGRRRHASEAHDLISRISDHSEAYLDQAREYADLIRERAEEQAEETLYHSMVRTSLSVEDWLRGRWETGRPVDIDELWQALTWLRALSYTMQVDLKVIDDALVREGQRQEEAAAAAVENPQR